jgi:Ca2+-transporting ATPase
MGGSVALQVLVVYAPFLQRAFGTTSLSLGDWAVCLAVASSVLWLREASKVVARRDSLTSPAPGQRV